MDGFHGPGLSNHAAHRDPQLLHRSLPAHGAEGAASLASLAQPDGVVRELVFPVASEQTLRDLVKEWKATLKRFSDSKVRYFRDGEDVPLDGIVTGLWRDAVVEADGEDRPRINRITYEICVLQALRERLRCKEIWVVGANRYRNPDEDLPADFEAEREPYYATLNLPSRLRVLPAARLPAAAEAQGDR
jgi:hypothetical protein